MIRLMTRVSVFGGDVAYQINLENIETGKISSISVNVRSAYGYKFVTGLPPGEYIVKEVVPLGLVNAKTESLNIKEHLIVEKGKISVLPVKFVVIIFTYTKRGGKSFSFYDECIEIDENQRSRILNVFRSQDNYNLWKE
jgi:hypothetical protein